MRSAVSAAAAGADLSGDAVARGGDAEHGLQAEKPYAGFRQVSGRFRAFRVLGGFWALGAPAALRAVGGKGARRGLRQAG